jgi:hypothetical protein
LDIDRLAREAMPAKKRDGPRKHAKASPFSAGD